LEAVPLAVRIRDNPSRGVLITLRSCLTGLTKNVALTHRPLPLLGLLLA
jgi:hypothetical protein